MPTVIHVKKARKDNKAAGIKKGQEYWYWSHQSGGRFVKTYFKTKPTRSQTTSSDFYATAYDLEDQLSSLIRDFNKGGVIDVGDIQSNLEGLANDVRELGEQQTEKHDNMPDGLQESETGQLLSDRADACETTAQNLEDAAQEISNLDIASDLAEEVSGILDSISWEL